MTEKMDGESATPTSMKVKKGRKGRPPKVKNSELMSQGEQHQSAQHTFTSDLPNSQEGGDQAIHQNSESNSRESSGYDHNDTNATSKNSRSSDTLLMPPPPALTSSADGHGNMEDKKTVQAAQENEEIVDGFSIFCYDCEDTVEVSN